MAEVVTIAHGDTISKILKNKRGVKDHEMNTWLRKLRTINPHISNLNHIYPDEQVLIPNTSHEMISDDQVWQNAFSRIPRALEFPHDGHTQLFLTTAGTPIDSIAERMFAEGLHRGLPLSTKRAVLIHNNPDLVHCLDTGRVPGKLLVDITPLRLSRFDKSFWQQERSSYMSCLQQLDPATRDMFQDVGPEDTFILARLMQALQEAGASVGTDDIIKGVNYGVAGVSGLSASSVSAVSNINALAHQIYDDAVKEFGSKMVTSKNSSQLVKMTRFIKNHPSYHQLMQQVQKLPKALLPMHRAKLVPPAAHKVNSTALARHFRKQYFQAFQRWPSSKYMTTIAKQLNGRVNMFNRVGFGATWVVPSVIGLYNVHDAPPEVKMRTLFEEGFGIVGGAFGTWIGAQIAAPAAVGLFTICGLCLGPFGVFMTIFICASVGGIVGSERFKKSAGKFYDSFPPQFNAGQIYHSPEQFFWEAVK